MPRTLGTKSKTHPSSRPSSSINTRKITTRYNFRTQPLIPPIHYRFLNEENFPHLTRELENEQKIRLLYEDFSDYDYQPRTPPLPTTPPNLLPSPSPREVSPISIPEDINEIDLFGLEVITRSPTPESESSTSSTSTSGQLTPEIIEIPSDSNSDDFTPSPTPSDDTLLESTLDNSSYQPTLEEYDSRQNE